VFRPKAIAAIAGLAAALVLAACLAGPLWLPLFGVAI
jgi:hypothetical protein